MCSRLHEYEIEYFVIGLERIAERKEPVERSYHTVQIKLTSDYPRMSPACKMLTPIFHPNIEPATICVGDHWTAGERLVDLVVRIGEMIAYQAYNVKSPLDGEAAMWADLHLKELPVDDRKIASPRGSIDRRLRSSRKKNENTFLTFHLLAPRVT